MLGMPYRTLPPLSAADLEHALRTAHWNKSEAARQLGVSRPTLYALIARHGIVVTRSTVRVLD
jgi:transcriptional regulator of acetoin/glycerol metabolism